MQFHIKRVPLPCIACQKQPSAKANVCWEEKNQELCIKQMDLQYIAIVLQHASTLKHIGLGIPEHKNIRTCLACVEYTRPSATQVVARRPIG